MLTGIITKSQVILKHYVFSIYFVLDVAAVIPLEFFGLAWDTEDRYGYVAVFRLNRLIKIWKVLFMYRANVYMFFCCSNTHCPCTVPSPSLTHQVMSFFNQMEGSLYISVVYARALKFTFYILTVTHLSACIWFPLACYSQNTYVCTLSFRYSIVLLIMCLYIHNVMYMDVIFCDLAYYSQSIYIHVCTFIFINHPSHNNMLMHMHIDVIFYFPLHLPIMQTCIQLL